MILDKPLETDDEPAVPDMVRLKLTRILKGARQLNVYEIPAEGRAAKANGMKLKARKGALPADVDIDDLALMVTKIMHVRWLERALEDGDEYGDPVKFKIESIRDDEKVKRPSFFYAYSPEVIQSDPYGEVQQLETMHIAQMLDQTSAHLGLMMEANGEMLERFIRICELNAKPLGAVAEQLEQAGKMYTGAMQAMVWNIEHRNAHEIAKSAEEGKTERSKMMWERLEKLGKPLEKVVDQFAPWVVSKVTGIPVEQKRGEATRPRASSRRPNGHNPRPTVVPETEASEPNAPEVDEQNPMAALANVFGDGITAKQRRALKGKLSPEQIDAFDEIFCAETDDETVTLYKALKAQLDANTLLAMNAILDPDQRRVFGQFTKMAERALRAQPAKEPKVDEGDDDKPDPPTDG